MQPVETYPKKVEHKAKAGTFHVTVYKTPIKNQDAFTLAWYECEKRRRKVITDEAKALDEAGKIAKRLAGGEMRLAPGDAQVYTAALDVVREIKIGGTSMPLDEVCRAYAEAFKLTGGKVAEAALDFSRRDMSAIIEGKLLADAVKEYLESRGKDVSEHYLREYTAKLNALSDSFIGYSMVQLEPHRVDDYLRGLDVSSRTRKNARAVLLRFFKWAKARKYIPRSFDFKEGVAVVKAHEGEIEIYTPDELQKLLANAQESIVPFVAIAAFAGLRHAEIGRLDWAQIDFDEGHIEVKAANSKTRSRRLVPLLPVLKAWLKPYRKKSGRICSREDMGDSLLWLAEKTEMPWKHNGLRHSFISYRLAIVKAEGQVALEAGNSPTVIFKNYRQLVKDAAAEAWFAVMPPAAPENMVEFAADTTKPAESRPLSAARR